MVSPFRSYSSLYSIPFKQGLNNHNCFLLCYVQKLRQGGIPLIYSLLESRQKRLKKTKDLRAPILEELLGKIYCALLEVCHSEYEILLLKSALMVYLGQGSQCILRNSALYATTNWRYSLVRQKAPPVSPFPYGSQKQTKRDRGFVLFCHPFSKACPVSRLQKFLEARRRVQDFLFVHDAKSQLNRFRFNAVLRKNPAKN